MNVSPPEREKERVRSERERESESERDTEKACDRYLFFLIYIYRRPDQDLSGQERYVKSKVCDISVAPGPR